jgi:nitronate monooxygenase
MPAAAQLRRLSRLPLVVAPMAGGPSTPGLVIAAAQAGAVGFLAAGYKTAAAMAGEIAEVRAGTDGAFGVNVFVPGQPTSDPEALVAYVDGLAPEAAEIGAVVGDPQWDDDAYWAKLDTLVADPPPLVSFTFGCPSRDVVHALQAADALVAVTVTTAGEAAAAGHVGADCLCLQGAEAGAHRGSFTNEVTPAQDLLLMELLAAVRRTTDLALIAAGGVTTAADVAAVLAAGATQAQLGTAFVRCTESGANPAYKAALVDSRFTTTAMTRAFSGRPARSLENGFMRAHGDAPAAYPEINNATRALRAAAAAAGQPDRMSLYAGVGFRQAEARPAGDIIERLTAGLGAGPST